MGKERRICSAPGTTTVSATIPGFASVADASREVTVGPAALDVLTDTIRTASGLRSTRAVIRLNGRDHGGATPTARAGDGAKLALTERQRAVLRCLHAGKSNKMIARELDMRESTVKVHVRSILRKLGAINRTQAALAAVAVGDLDQPRQTVDAAPAVSV